MQALKKKRIILLKAISPRRSKGKGKGIRARDRAPKFPLPLPATITGQLYQLYGFRHA